MHLPIPVSQLQFCTNTDLHVCALAVRLCQLQHLKSATVKCEVQSEKAQLQITALFPAYICANSMFMPTAIMLSQLDIKILK